MPKVKFNDDFVYDGLHKAGETKEVTQEQFDVMSKQFCGYNKALPLIEEVKGDSKPETVKTEKPK